MVFNIKGAHVVSQRICGSSFAAVCGAGFLLVLARALAVLLALTFRRTTAATCRVEKGKTDLIMHNSLLMIQSVS